LNAVRADDASGKAKAQDRMYDRIVAGQHAFTQDVIMPSYFLQKLLRCGRCPNRPSLGTCVVWLASCLFRLRTESGHSALRIIAFTTSLVAAFVRGILTWFAPASLFLAFHTVLLTWAGRGDHMHVFEALYGALFFTVVRWLRDISSQLSLTVSLSVFFCC
jgi:hypothetical protein